MDNSVARAFNAYLALSMEQRKEFDGLRIDFMSNPVPTPQEVSPGVFSLNPGDLADRVDFVQSFNVQWQHANEDDPVRGKCPYCGRENAPTLSSST